MFVFCELKRAVLLVDTKESVLLVDVNWLTLLVEVVADALLIEDMSVLIFEVSVMVSEATGLGLVVDTIVLLPIIEASEVVLLLDKAVEAVLTPKIMGVTLTLGKAVVTILVVDTVTEVVLLVQTVEAVVLLVEAIEVVFAIAID